MSAPNAHAHDEITPTRSHVAQPNKVEESYGHEEDTFGEKVKTAPGAGNDGDVGAKWLAEYTGERRELTDKDSEAVRRRVSRDRHVGIGSSLTAD